MRKRYVLILIIALSYFGPASSAQNQPSSNEGFTQSRAQSGPSIPASGETDEPGWNRKGSRRGRARGNVKKVEPVGGSPLFVEAAQSAIAQWKYAPGAESRETVELHFTP